MTRDAQLAGQLTWTSGLEVSDSAWRAEEDLVRSSRLTSEYSAEQRACEAKRLIIGLVEDVERQD